MKYLLCNECNFKRTHKGKTQFDVAKEKSLLNYQKRKNNVSSVILQRKKKPKRIMISKKQQEIKKQLHLTYNEIDNEREHLCDGCGTNEALCHSHIISQIDCKLIGKPELIYDKRNIHYHCMSPVNNCCNQKWESKDSKIMSQLFDYEINMEFIRSQSIELYNVIVNK
jgi:hypothetical protein